MNAPSVASNAPLLQVKDLQVRFGGSRKAGAVRAVDGLSLTIDQGKTVGLIGESGSGKTTVGRTIVGLEKPNDGAIVYMGSDISELRRSDKRQWRSDVQIIFQDPSEALDPRMRIGASVAEPLRITTGNWSRRFQKKVVEVLERVGLDSGYVNRYPHELSGGQRQRVSIARALVLDPKLIVCDEVVSALDVSIQADILNLLADIQAERKISYLFISHDLSVVAHVADQVCVMYLGVIIESGPVNGVLRSPAHPYTQGLLDAQPVAEPGSAGPLERKLIQGDMPSPSNPPAGCRFNTRCPHAQERCRVEIPVLRELQPGHYGACHFAEELQRTKEPPKLLPTSD
ncbi:peptide/nickel transport system ATP-binding protein [Antricoccus suffuscus]|uniref:Peptide/nickel transport system ATP-binding protein n=1 Tax=Antricoccus suffuscus TaxID=1629062 RepID=A0A2T0ZTU3_9ACTN|nr:ABC transporter ATP-binding protein [Antricoccus suffuscus]PRZ39724.1 peptide/nickel transport system ATP-binding protein [Antricoccus suffuscus]